MTELEAVNEMLEWIQEPPVTAIATTDDSGECQTTLNRKTLDVLKRSWWTNERKEVAFGVPTIKIAHGTITGTFIYTELVTESTSNATGYFAYKEGGFVYLNYVSGTFTGNKTLTSEGGATTLGGSYTLIDEAKLNFGPNVIKAIPSPGIERLDLSMREGFFFNKTDDTFVFQESDGGVTMDIAVLMDFADLPPGLADYVCKEAAYSFLRYKMPGRTEGLDERRLEVQRARVFALQEDSDLRKTNLHKTYSGRAMLGFRNSYPAC